jgi:hypothetical protein
MGRSSESGKVKYVNYLISCRQAQGPPAPTFYPIGTGDPSPRVERQEREAHHLSATGADVKQT